MIDRSPSSRKPPVTVTIFAILVLIIAVTNLIRLWAAIQYWETLVNIGVSPGPMYIAITGLIWSLVGSYLVWMLWAGRPGSRIAIIVVSSLYIIYYWLDRLVFRSHFPQQNSPFITGVSILVVFYMIITLLLPSNQEFFSRKHGR
jgi:hypothetical protein